VIVKDLENNKIQLRKLQVIGAFFM